MGVAVIGLSMVVAACGGGSAEPASETAAPSPPLVVAAWEGMGVENLCVESAEVYFGGLVQGSAVVVEGITPVHDGIVTAFTRDSRMRVGIVTEERETIVVGDQEIAVDPVVGCDATIQVRVEGWARSADYLNAGRLYTGAEVSGTLTLVAPGRPSLSASVSGDKPTAGGVQGADVERGRSPAGAPFWEAVNASVCGVLIDWFGASDPLTLDLLAEDAMLDSTGRMITGDCPGHERDPAS